MVLINRLQTSRYLIALVLVICVLFLVFSFAIFRTYTQAQNVSSWTVYNYEILRRCRTILLDLVDMETGVRGYMLTGNDVFLEPYNHSQATLRDQVKSLKDYTLVDKEVYDAIAGWLVKIEAFKKTLDAQVTLVKIKGPQAISKSQIAEQKKQMDVLRQAIEGFMHIRLSKLSTTIENSREAHKDFRYVLVIGTLLAIGSMLLIASVILALLARNRRSEKIVRDQEERFKAIMNGINDGLYDLNFIENSIYYSPSYKTMLGYEDQELADTQDASIELIHPDDKKSALEVLEQYRSGQIPHYTNVFRMLHKNGTWRWILSRAIGLRDERGAMIRLIGTHTDITEHKKREEELALVNSEMETFTYITSHDLRAPLVNLRGFASEMAHAVKRVLPIMRANNSQFTSDEQKILTEALESDIPESLKYIEQSVLKMDALTTAVLDLSRIGKREYRVERVDVNKIVQRCIDTQSYEINQKNIEVKCDELPVIHSDALAIEQIFSNVIDNAIKYLSPHRAGQISISSYATAHEVVFSITDNGRGIAKEDHEKIFQIFRRARNSMDVRGMGMGMAFVQATVRRLGGSIWFISEVGEGTTFYIKLPKKPALKGN